MSASGPAAHARWTVLFVLAMAMATGGCGLEVRDRLRGVNETIARARENGAYACAPRELAMAETHAEFTGDELRYGNYAGALDEIEVAAHNARLAFDRSPRDRCAPRAAVDKKAPLPLTPMDTDGDGVVDPADGCPAVPGPRENAGCPWPDRDHDGIADKDDRCPDEAGPRELQGCPDRDKDGIVDREDQCPDEAGPPANHGCPYKLIVVTREKIELRQKVFFDTDKATIKRVSHPMLDEIAQLLAKSRTVEVRIEGHTDSRASLKHNLRLSQARASSVRKYLVGRGIDATRMTAIGYGPKRPIQDNRTAIGREANRRVEFFITKQ